MPTRYGLTRQPSNTFLKSLKVDSLEGFFKRVTSTIDKNDRIEALAESAEMLFVDGHEEEAHQMLIEALRTNPGSLKSHNSLALFYWQTGEAKKAVHHFGRARDIDPYDRDTVWNCGQVMSSLGERLMTKYTYSSFMKYNGYDWEMTQAINAL